MFCFNHFITIQCFVHVDGCTGIENYQIFSSFSFILYTLYPSVWVKFFWRGWHNNTLGLFNASRRWDGFWNLTSFILRYIHFIHGLCPPHLLHAKPEHGYCGKNEGPDHTQHSNNHEAQAVRLVCVKRVCHLVKWDPTQKNTIKIQCSCWHWKVKDLLPVVQPRRQYQ